MSESLPDYPEWSDRPSRATPINRANLLRERSANLARIDSVREESETALTSKLDSGPSPYISPLRKWFAAMSGRASASAQVLVIGDSISEGTGASTLGNRWQSLLQQSLSPTGAAWPFIPGKYQTSTTGGPLATSGTVTINSGTGLGWRTAAVAAGASLTYTFTGTRAKLAYLRASATGKMSIVVDGAAAVVVDTNSSVAPGAASSAIWDSGALPAGQHTIVVTRDASSTSGQNPYVHGLFTFNNDEASGVRVLDGSKSGIQSATWTTGSLASMNAVLVNAGTSTIKLVIIEVGTNDFSAGVTPSAYAANIQTLIASLRANGIDASFLLLGAYLAQGRDGGAWQAYHDQLALIAAGDADVDYLDLRKYMPTIPTPTTATSGLGLYADALHPADAGNGWIAQVVQGHISLATAAMTSN